MPDENPAAAPGATGANAQTGESTPATTSLPETSASDILREANVPEEVVKAFTGTEDGGQRTEDRGQRIAANNRSYPNSQVNPLASRK
jgi:hypothetical protein